MRLLIAEHTVNVAFNYASQSYVLDTGRVVLSRSTAPLLVRDMTFVWANSKG